MSSLRNEQDSMGPMQIPADAYYGAQTARAVENFPVSSLRLQPAFIRAVALIKSGAAEVSSELGLLDGQRRDWIVAAARDVVEGQFADQFVVDVFQTGSGTSTNMNVNEVIASRANELATGKRGGREPVHPNDHVNLQQSSNDVIPSAMQIAAGVAIRDELVPALDSLLQALAERATNFADVLKIGRTHLQDATPIRLGQEFSGYARQVQLSIARAERALDMLRELPLGGTAVGTGINSHPKFAVRTIEKIAAATGIAWTEATNHFEAQSARDAIVEASGQLRTIALSLAKIASDLRQLASGPRCGLGEINLPATQPGSSIMPGKVNPVMCEMILQISAKVIGNDATIAFAASPVGSVFELNMMMPVMAFALLESIELLTRGSQIFADRCVRGISANRERCESLVEQSLAMATSLVPLIGYDEAARIAKESLQTGRTVRDIAHEHPRLTPEQIKSALDPSQMTAPTTTNLGSGG